MCMQTHFVSNLIHCSRKDIINRVETDLGIKLYVKEITLREEIFSNWDQVLPDVLIILVIDHILSILANICSVFF